MIPRDECKHGHTYKIRSRNLTVGVFDSKDGGFVGIREKFGNLYLFPEYHRDNGPPYGTVTPEREIEKCPIDDIRDHLDTVCGHCQKRVDWRPNEPGGGVGKWHHIEETDCQKEVSPGSPQNQPLYDYLEKVTDREDLVSFIEELEKNIEKEDGYLHWQLNRGRHLIVGSEEEFLRDFKIDKKVAQSWSDGSKIPPPETRKAVYEWLLKKAKARKEVT